ncbi:MAG: hypothetical protein ACR65R_04215, partial [Methylomicrobium sp.]
MKRIRFIQVWVLLAYALFAGLNPAQAQPTSSDTLDTATIEKLTGVKGKLDAAEQVFKVSAPRSDLKVTVAG